MESADGQSKCSLLDCLRGGSKEVIPGAKENLKYKLAAQASASRRTAYEEELKHRGTELTYTPSLCDLRASVFQIDLPQRTKIADPACMSILGITKFPEEPSCEC